MNNKVMGYEWADIQRSQQRGRLAPAIDTSRPAGEAATDDDRALLAQHGMDGLRALGLWGVVDRLERAEA